MEVRKDYAKRATALATSTPREAIANLLRSLLPREPVATRPIAGAVQTQRPDGKYVPIRLERDPFRPMRPVRVRKLRNQRYEPTGRRNQARPGTKRWSQLNIVLANTDTRSARLAGAESVDITFAVDEGYIKFID